MGNGDVITSTIPTDLDYLAPADTALTIIASGVNYAAVLADNITFTIVDVTGRNSVRKVVVVVSAIQLA